MIYDYKCNNGHVQEIVHGMNESPKIYCNKCKELMHRIITGGRGIIFKGDGWTPNSSFKKSMTKKNTKAGQKAKDHIKPITSMKDLQ